MVYTDNCVPVKRVVPLTNLSFALNHQVVMECIHKNRIGDVNYNNLALAIQTQTRAIVGEWHWTRARLIILYARQASRKKYKLQQQQKEDSDGANRKGSPRQVASRTA
jgi:hypothetical protein